MSLLLYLSSNLVLRLYIAPFFIFNYEVIIYVTFDLVNWLA